MPKKIAQEPEPTRDQMRDCESISPDITVLMSAWTKSSAGNQSHFHNCRLSSIFSFFGFGSLVCTMLIHKENMVLGFLFLLITMTFAAILDQFYKRKESAWTDTQKEIDERSFEISVFGFVNYMKRYEEFETPQEIFERYYAKRCQSFSTDMLSSLIIAIALCIAVITGVILVSERLEINWKEDDVTESIDKLPSPP